MFQLVNKINMFRFMLCAVFCVLTLDVGNVFAWKKGGGVVVAAGLQRQTRQIDNNAVLTPAVIESMNILSQTISRYTQVTINSVVVNDDMEPKEASFIMQIPEKAFISNFSMVINGSVFVASVLEKEAAQKKYEQAQDRGESAGQVSVAAKPPPRGMENFMININVAGQSSVDFQLVYHDLLERRFEMYRQIISLRPGQVIQDLKVHAQLYEPDGFTSFKFARPGESQLMDSSHPNSLQLRATPNMRQLTYTPTVAEQTSKNPSSVGLDGDLIIEYDVNHQTGGGELVIEDGYFVHHISPSGPTLDKNVVFLIDVSGSMGGYKVEQTRQAMIAILSQLRPNDYFNLLLFSSSVKHWQETPVLGNKGNIENAIQYVKDNVVAGGGTNINEGLCSAGKSLSNMMTGMSGSKGKMIIFLTDGNPSVGVTDPNMILQDVSTWNSDSRIPVFSLGFGEDVSFDFLERISAENFGFARKIYYDEIKDAGNQLETFFLEIESILLIDVTVTYEVGAVEESSLSTTFFPQYFKGTELVIAGQMKPSAPVSWNAVVRGGGKTAAVSYDVAVSSSNVQNKTLAPWANGFAKKIHAYLKINKLLRDMLIEQDATKKTALKKRALDLSLQNNFVTPVTSMVIVQKPSPNQQLQEHMAYQPRSKVQDSRVILAAMGNVGGVSLLSPSIILIFITIAVQIFK